MRGGDVNVKRTMLALDYSFIDVLSDENDEDVMSRIHVWQLDGDTDYKELIPLALSDDNFETSAILITLDIRKPWDLVSSLLSWCEFVEEHIHKHISPEILKKGKRRVIKYYQSFREGRAGRSRLNEDEEGDDDNLDMEIDQEIISNNLGIPVIVVCTKCDYLDVLEVEKRYTPDHFIYMQTNLRSICLKYAATLIYSSAAKDINCDLLLHYLQHRLYSKVVFDREASTKERSEIFIPFGYDTAVKIDWDFKNQNLTTDIDYPYHEIIKPPTSKIKEDTTEPTIHAIPDDIFLERYFENTGNRESNTNFLEVFNNERSDTPKVNIVEVEFESESPYTTPQKKDSQSDNSSEKDDLKAKFYQLLKTANKTPSPNSTGKHAGVPSTDSPSKRLDRLRKGTAKFDAIKKKRNSSSKNE